MEKHKSDKRIHVKFSDTTREILEIISEKENKSLSEIVRQFTEQWMERYEDQYWCEIASQSQGGATLSHEEVWKDV